MDATQKCYFFIDDSNLWIEAKKLAARGTNFLPALQGTGGRNEDPRLRIDLGRLITRIANGRQVPQNSSFMYGSRPPPNDSVWRSAQKLGFDVEIFDRERNSPHGREKEVDNAMATRISEQATALDVAAKYVKEKLEEKKQAVFVVLTGDRDMRPPISLVLEKDISVELWTWSTGLSREYRKMAAGNDLLSICDLDSIYNDITFIEYRSTLQHGNVDARVSVVLCDFVDRDHYTDVQWETYIGGEKLAELHRLFYISWSTSCNEIVVEHPNADAKELEELFIRTQKLFGGEVKVISYPEFKSRNRQKEVTWQSIAVTYQLLDEPLKAVPKHERIQVAEAQPSAGKALHKNSGPDRDDNNEG